MDDAQAALIAQGKDITTTLTDTEKFKLDQCERIIRDNLKTFLTVGHALAEIRDNRLYRETHQTFEKYCKEVWDLSKSSAYQKIDGYQAVNLLEQKSPQLRTFSDEGPAQKCLNCEHRKAMANRAHKGVRIPWTHGKCTRPEGLCMQETALGEPEPSPEEIILPLNEAQTRPLTRLKDPDDQVKAWELVLQKMNEDPEKKLTATLIAKAVKEVSGETRRKRVVNVKQEVDRTTLVSPMFKRQYQVMLDIISEERNTNWKTTSPKEAVRWLNQMIKIIEDN